MSVTVAISVDSHDLLNTTQYKQVRCYAYNFNHTKRDIATKYTTSFEYYPAYPMCNDPFEPH